MRLVAFVMAGALVLTSCTQTPTTTKGAGGGSGVVISADGYAEDAPAAVELVRGLLG